MCRKSTMYGDVRMKEMKEESCKDLEAREGRGKRRTQFPPSRTTLLLLRAFRWNDSGRVLGLPDSTLTQDGIGRNVSVWMCFRVKGGARHDVPGTWTCMVCNMGGCWPVREGCFRCGSSRGTGPQAPAGRETRYPGRGSGGPSNSGCPERLVSNVPVCLCVVSLGRKEVRASF